MRPTTRRESQNQWRWLVVISLAGLFITTGCDHVNEQAAPDSATGPSTTPLPTITVAPDRAALPRRKRRDGTPAIREVSFAEAGTSATPVRATAPTPVASAGHPVNSPEAAAVAQQAMARLTRVDLSQGSLSPEQARELNQSLQLLAQQGAAAVPAIREFLQRNEDIVFDDVKGGNAVEYGSLRLGLIDILGSIGGADAVTAVSQVLQTAAEPLEVALLTRTLEEQAPKQYRDQEVTAASEALAQALKGQIPGGDMSPLFETLQAVGDAKVVPLLKQAAVQWNYYATLALAGLPDGVGIPALIELANDPAISGLGPGDFALRPLAQVALIYPDAANALIAQARANQIPDKAWPSVIVTVAGTSIQYGNQIFGPTSPPVSSSPAELGQRVAFLNQLLAVTPSAAARQSIQTAIATLVSHLPK